VDSAPPAAGGSLTLRRRLPLFPIVAASYAACSVLSFAGFAALGFGPTFFPAAGLALAVLCRRPTHDWPLVLGAVATAEFVVDLSMGLALPAAAGYAVANTVEPALGALLVTRGLDDALDLGRRGDLGRFLVGAVLTATVLGGVLGATVDLLFGAASGWLGFVGRWWVGDGLGVLVIGSLLLAWTTPAEGDTTRKDALAGGAAVAILAVLTVPAFWLDQLWLAYLIVVALVFVAVRFGVRAIAASGVLLAISASAAAAGHSALLGRLLGPGSAGIVYLQVFLGVLLITLLVLASEVQDRERVVRNYAEAAAARTLAEEREHQQRTIALALQNSLLPSGTPTVADVRVAALYRPSELGLAVGGDWYDVLALPDGRLAVTIGDVVGHGLEAAAAMGQLRSAASALALTDPGPAALLAALDDFAERVPNARFASVCYAELDLASGTLTYAAAAHPPPLLVHPDGSITFLEGGRSTPLCVAGHGPRPSATHVLTAGSTLVFYTDGLIETRQRPLEDEFDHLAGVCARLHDVEPAALCEALLAGQLAGGRPRDDIALVCVRYAPVGLLETGSAARPPSGNAHGT
jgi:serine phosphatase RsbU (regulator of sigma subunit)/integral membrane sensor domain MASE1